MQQLEIKVRARSEKEALNLGFIVGRHYFLSLFMAALPFWLLSVALSVLLWWQTGSALWMLFLLWWLKPLYERPVLMRLSRLIFSQPTDWKSEQKSAFAQGWFAELTYLRLFRSFAPIRHAVNCLEDLQGKQKRNRLKFLASMAYGGGKVLTLLSLFETALMFIFIWLLFNVSFGNLADFLRYLLNEPEVLHRVLALSYALFSLFTTVFYISAGFTLYLNCRVITEGWAVAIDIQHLAKRLLQCVLIVFLGLGLLSSPSSYAFTEQDSAQDKAWVQAQVQGKSGPYAYVPAKNQAQANESSRDFYDFRKWIPDGSFSEFVRFILIAIGVMLIIWVIYHIAQSKGFVLHKSSSASSPTEVSVVERAAALETLQAARQFAQQGELLRAVAILYAHWRQDYQHYRLPAIMADETESEYLSRVSAQASAAQLNFLQQLFALWQQGAYAHLALNQAQVMALLERYQQLWRGV